MSLLTGRWRGPVVLVLVALALAAPAACGDDKRQGAQATATSGPPDPAALLRQAADRMEQVNSFHFVLDHEAGTSPITLGTGLSLTMSRAEGDVQQPDRLRADVTATLGGVRVNFKLVSVGDATKFTVPFAPNRWQDLPTGTKLRDVFDPAAGTTAALRNVRDAQIAGEDTIDGKRVWRITGTVDAGNLTAIAPIAQPGYTAKATVWIGRDDPLVYRIRLEGPLGPDDTPGVIRRLDLSRFNETISITPVPG
jgi:hypothetical protein